MVCSVRWLFAENLLYQSPIHVADTRGVLNGAVIQLAHPSDRTESINANRHQMRIFCFATFFVDTRSTQLVAPYRHWQRGSTLYCEECGWVGCHLVANNMRRTIETENSLHQLFSICVISEKETKHLRIYIISIANPTAKCWQSGSIKVFVVYNLKIDQKHLRPAECWWCRLV